MNEAVVAAALKQLVSDNSSSLTSGLTVGDMTKSIQQLTQSVLTPPSLFYFVAIDISGAASYYRRAAGTPRNMTHAAMQASNMLLDEYDARIYCVEYAVKTTPLEETVQSFEEEHVLFRTFTDRLVNLLDRTERITSGTYSMWIPGEGDEDRRIRKDYTYNIWEDGDGQHFGISCQVTFQLRACSTSAAS